MSQFCTCTGSCRKKAGSKLGEGWVCVLDILPERRKADNWRPIETAPGGVYVLAFGEYYGRRPMLAMKTGGVWYEGNKPIEPTHWMEIPPLPAVECKHESVNAGKFLGRKRKKNNERETPRRLRNKFRGASLQLRRTVHERNSGYGNNERESRGSP